MAVTCFTNYLNGTLNPPTKDNCYWPGGQQAFLHRAANISRQFCLSRLSLLGQAADSPDVAASFSIWPLHSAACQKKSCLKNMRAYGAKLPIAARTFPKTQLIFFPPIWFSSPAEDEGGQLGRVEEHPRAASLGGIPGISGAAAEPRAGPAELRKWAEPLAPVRTQTYLGVSWRTRPLGLYRHLLVADCTTKNNQ